jgi:hypothetical protein
MIESPVLQGLLAENTQKTILGFLEERFGPVPPEISTVLTAITNSDQLQRLARVAARCSDLEAFRQQLAPN